MERPRLLEAIRRLNTAAISWRRWMANQPTHVAVFALLTALSCEVRAQGLRRRLLEDMTVEARRRSSL